MGQEIKLHCGRGFVGKASHEKEFLVGSWRKYWIGLCKGESHAKVRLASVVTVWIPGSRLQDVPENEETGPQEALQPIRA